MVNMNSPIGKNNNVRYLFDPPNSSFTYQVPYKSTMVEVPLLIPNSNMEEDILISKRFILSDFIDPKYQFNGEAERTAYFVVHPEELIEGLLVLDYGYDVYKYVGSSWVLQETIDILLENIEDYYITHPDELVDNMIVMGIDGYFQYVNSTWEYVEDYYTLSGGWLPYSYGFQLQSIEMTTENSHSGTQCIKVVHQSDGGGDWYGGGVIQNNINFTGISKISVWLRGEDNAISSQVRLTSPTMSSPFDNALLTSEWQEYIFDVSVYHREIGSIEIVIGESYSGYGSIYTVYIDDVKVYRAPSKEISWISDLDTYISNSIDTVLETNAYTDTDQILCRKTQLNAFPSGDMEGNILPLWYGPDEGEILSLSQHVFHSGTQSLKTSFFKEAESTKTSSISIDNIDLTDRTTIDCYVYGNEDSYDTGITIDTNLYNTIIPGVWTLCSFPIIPANRIPDQTVTFGFLNYTATYDCNIEVYIDDIVAVETIPQKYDWIPLPVTIPGVAPDGYGGVNIQTDDLEVRREDTDQTINLYSSAAYSGIFLYGNNNEYISSTVGDYGPILDIVNYTSPTSKDTYIEPAFIGVYDTGDGKDKWAEVSPEYIVVGDAYANGDDDWSKVNITATNIYISEPDILHEDSINYDFYNEKNLNITQFPTIDTGSVAPDYTPTKPGDIFVDTSAKVSYIACGTSSFSDWKQITT